MNGHVQYRGLPPPPHGDFICDSGNPPPCPRDLYSQSQIYDTIPANQGEYGSQRRSAPAPAPPRRSPSTRLSTGSRTSSSSSGIYDDTAMYMDDSHHSPQHQAQPSHPPINIPPLQMSPRLQKKMVASPLVSPRSPSHQNPNKPFSYIVNLPGSPKTHRRSSDGKYYDVPDVSPPGDPTYEPIGQPHPYSQVEKHKAPSSGQYGAPASPGHQSPNLYSQGQGHPATPASPGHQSQGYYGQGQGHPASNGGQYGAPASPGHQGQGYYGQGQGGHTYSPQGQHHGQLPAMQQPQYSPSHRTASPPPLPKVGPGSAPHSPSLQRKSSLTRKNEKVSSPVMPRKSADPRVVTPDPGAMYMDSVPKTEGQRSGHGPPSFPAPPPPLPVAARFVAATLENNRPPSPPLPPPPPEMISDSSPHSSPHKVPPPVVPPTVPKVANPPPPPPPPISKIPGRPQISSFEIGKKQSKGDESHDQGNRKQPQHTMPLPGQAAVPRPNQQKQQQIQSKNLVEELSKVTLRKGPQNIVQQPEPQPVVEEPTVKPSPPKPPEKTNPSSEKEHAAAFLPKLKSTGAKPWEKGQNMPHPHMDDDDLPPPPPPPMDDDFLPPPPPPPGNTPNMDLYQTGAQQRYKKDSSPDPERKPDSGIGSNSSLSSMEIDLDDIDFSQIPGYTPINSSIPNWKKDMVEKKNREKLEEYLNEMRRRKAEEEKWKNVPEWKRKLLVEKEKLKREEDDMKTNAQKEEEQRRKDERRQQIEEEKMNEEEDAALPAWKREIMAKRGGALRNWGDEREEENENLEEQ